MLPRLVPLVAIALLAAPLAGCIDLDDPLDAAGTARSGEGALDTSRGWSVPTAPALYDMLPGVKEWVTSFDGTPISLGIFYPEKPGCDWTASDLPESCRLPVVMDAGPYYANVVDVDKYRPPIIEWLVPRGYVVVQMSVRGSGESGGCMEMMSMSEQRDVDHVITWLAEQPFSNGNVGMMGRSYDGTTPLMGAALGNPHLKTIVPIVGVTDIGSLMFKNGTSESRGPIMHSVVYWSTFGVAEGGHRVPHWPEQFCEEFVMGTVEGPRALLTGDVGTDYWEVRDFRQRIIDNYEGSIWIVHGLEDWNVNPSQVVPWINELQDAGIETRAWLGQWAHHYPDRVDEHRNVRWDWAQQTLEWFDHYLKGEGAKPPLTVEVEDSLYVWREEASYPPRDAMRVTDTVTWTGTDPLARGNTIGWDSETLDSDLRIAGLPRLHATVTPSANAPTYVFAELYDVWPDGRTVRIGWSAIDLRYHAGGNTNPDTLVPGQPVVAKMEFEPVDALVAEGHRLRLLVHMDGVEMIVESPTPGPVLFDWDATTLSLPVVDRPSIIPSYVPPTLGEA